MSEEAIDGEVCPLTKMSIDQNIDQSQIIDTHLQEEQYMLMKGRYVSVTKDGSPELTEKSILKRLGKKVSKYGF